MGGRGQKRQRPDAARYDKLRRSHHRRRLRREHVVLTEGKTEAEFIEGVRRRHRLSNVQVRVIGQVGEPGRIVEEAKQERAKREGRPGEDWLIHVVFDRDEHPRFSSACEDARQCRFVLGVSVPCFEIWLILLKGEHSAALTRRAAQRRCRELHPGYCHQRSPVVNGEAIPDDELQAAARRARQLAARAEGERFPNPSSTFSDVLEAILADLEDD